MYYKSKKKGEIEIEVLNSKNISLIENYEEDKMIKMYLHFGDSFSKYKFKVNDHKHAMDILKRMHDDTDVSIIELEYY